MSNRVRGRAHTSEEKRAVVEAVLAAWERWPEQRLGQLIRNCFSVLECSDANTLAVIEDQTLVDCLNRFTLGKRGAP